MAYVMQGVVGGLGVSRHERAAAHYVYGVGGGLGDDSKKDALLIAKLKAQAARGDPGAEQALKEAIAMQPAQKAWDLNAMTMRAAAEPTIPKSPAAARNIALAALESSIKKALGPRPEPHSVEYWAAQVNPHGGDSSTSSDGGALDFLTGKTDVEVGGTKVSSTTLLVGGLVLAGLAFALIR